MAVTREQIEGQSKAKTDNGMTRKEGIDEVLDGAKNGFRRAQKEVTDAQVALAHAKTENEIKIGLTQLPFRGNCISGRRGGATTDTGGSGQTAFQ